MNSSRTWRTAAELRARPELSVARDLLASWRAPDDAQARERDRIVALAPAVNECEDGTTSRFACPAAVTRY